MKRYKRVGWVVRIWVVLLITALGWYNSNFFADLSNPKNLKLGFYYLAQNIVIFEVNRLVLMAFYRRFWSQLSPARRVGFAFVLVALLCFALRVISLVLRSSMVESPVLTFSQLIMTSALSSIPFTWLIVAINEMFFVSAQTLSIEEEKEELDRASLQQQYDSLKEQVNPHFLFNNLNSLIALIGKDPARADAFVEEMSTVYRYLLRNNRENLTTLKEEINFIESYNHLLKTRFGQGFQSTINVDPAKLHHAIPPMTLQLLVENAVKHNVVSQERPLHLQVYTAEDTLVVANNRQKKTRAVTSTQVGLNNIDAKYKLLKQPGIIIQDTEEQFTVTIPLIKNN